MLIISITVSCLSLFLLGLGIFFGYKKFKKSSIRKSFLIANAVGFVAVSILLAKKLSYLPTGVGLSVGGILLLISFILFLKGEISRKQLKKKRSQRHLS